MPLPLGHLTVPISTCISRYASETLGPSGGHAWCASDGIPEHNDDPRLDAATQIASRHRVRMCKMRPRRLGEDEGRHKWSQTLILYDLVSIL